MPDWDFDYAEASAQGDRAAATVDKQQRRFALYPLPGLLANPPKVNWLIRKYMPAGCLALLFGDAEAGKSLLAIDWAARVSLGLDWNGHGTTAGPVVYIAGEGHAGLPARFRAWETEFGQTLGDNLVLSNIGAQFLTPESLGEVLEAVEGLPEIPALFVVDTLAANFGGGNENDTKDMVAFLEAVRQLHALAPLATVLLIHHPGHGDKTRARGAYALKGALDTEYRLENNDGLRELHCTKSKDFEPPLTTYLQLKPIELHWVDEDGDLIWSPVLIPTEPPDYQHKKITKQQRRFIKHMNDYMRQTKLFLPQNVNLLAPRPPKIGQFVLSEADFREYVIHRGGLTDSDKKNSQDRSFNRCRNDLQDAELIEVFEGWLWFADKPDI